MTGPRFSLGGLLLFVAVVALWCTSLRVANVAWTAVAATLTLAALLSSVLNACYAQGAARAFSAGFALFGGVYLLLVEWDWIGGQLGHDLTVGLSDLADLVIPEDTKTPTLNPTNLSLPNPAALVASRVRAQRLGNFVEIGRMVLALLFATAGGLIAQIAAARAELARPSLSSSRPHE